MKSVMREYWTQDSLEINDYIFVEGLGVGKVVGLIQKSDIIDGKIVERIDRQIRFEKGLSGKEPFRVAEFSIVNYVPSTANQVNKYKEQFKIHLKLNLEAI